MDRIDVDTSCLPVVIVTLEGEVSDQAYLEHLDKLTAIHKRRLARAVIFDASLSHMHAPRHARMQAQWVDEHRELLRANVLLTALVINRPVLRFALSAFFAITSLPGHFVITATRDEAKLRVSDALRSAGLEVPQALALS